MLPILSRLKTWWDAADRTQRTVTLGGIAALLLLLGVTASFATRTRYETFATGVEPLERGGMIAALKAANLDPQSDETGTVMVPAGKTEEAMLALGTAGKLPKTGHVGIDELGKINMGTSPGVEGETLRAVTQGAIESMLGKLDGVASATVIIAQPKERVFADQQVRPTASVAITEKGSGGLTRKEGRMIATLVARAVPGMTAGDVMVTGTNGVLYDGSDLTGSEGMKSELDEQEARFWEDKIRTKLDGFLGQGNSQVIASADLNMDHVTTDDHQVTPTDRPTSVQNHSESATGRGATAAGVVGAAANTGRAAPSQAVGGANGTGSYVNSDGTKVYDANVKEVHTVGAIGDLRGLSLSVIVNADKVSDVATIQDVVNSVLGGRIKMDAKGLPLPNQAFTAKVVAQKFDGTATAAAKAAEDARASSQRTQQILSLLPIGAILFVALLVAKQVGKISRSVLPAPAVADNALAEGVYVDALPGAEEGGLVPMLASLEAGTVEEPTPEAATIRDRVNPPLESIKKMAADRPEMVATLIKSMMLGEKS